MLEVLFICTGNICRSPLAEAFLRDRADRVLDEAVRVRSAGTWARSGHPAMPETVTSGRERGVDVDLHEASPLTAEAIERADLAIGMTTEHRDEAARIAPSAAARCFTLKELVVLLEALPSAPGSDVRERIAEAHALRTGPEAPEVRDTDVADPIGMGDAVYRAIAWEIEQHVDRLVEGLFGVEVAAAREA